MFDAQKIIGELAAPISGISIRSDAVARGDLFVAYPDADDNSDGRRGIADAIAAGAAAVVWEAKQFEWRDEWRVPNRALNNVRAAAGFLADCIYHHPSRELSVAATTGTNGKTTVSHFIAQLLTAAGYKSGIIGTLGAGEIDRLQGLGYSTPKAVTVHQWLRRFVDSKCKAVSLEASSHGLREGRLNGVAIKTAVFTQLGRDHLDYHRSLKHYAVSKAKLFKLPGVQSAVLNADDDFCRRLQTHLQKNKNADAPTVPTVLTYGKNGRDLKLRDAVAVADGFELTLDYRGQQHHCRLPVAGVYNLHNFMAAALAATQLGLSFAEVLAAAHSLKLPAGRLQQINRAPDIFVDYAHTPDAFEILLSSMQPVAAQRGGRLWVVFGCGGDRDRNKRALMGAAAAQRADAVVVTDDNPRGEQASAIRAEVLAAIPQTKAAEIAGREEAIAHTIAVADAKDTILILGKGHECYQQRGGEQIYFSDAEVAQRCLQQLQSQSPPRQKEQRQ